MEFATSLSTGKTYEAVKVSYAQAKALKLVCPVCKEKVFKRVRRIPHETHMFAHHKGGSPDCELYFPATSDGPSTTAGLSAPRGQTFEQFIRDIDADLRNLLIAAQIIPERGIDERVLRLIAALVAKEARNLTPSFKAVEASGNTVLGNSTENAQAEIIAPLIFEFYTRDGARFIDTLFAQWVLYCISFKDERADISVVLDSLIRQQKIFSDLAGTMLAGLALYYSDEDLSLFAEEFSIQMDGILSIDIDETASGHGEPSVVFRDHSNAPEMIVLPRGQFVMGSSQDGPGHEDTESPQHTVHISYALAVGKYPITFAQWDACVKDGGTKYKPDDEGWGRGSRPVINVSWDDTQLYLEWLSKVTGKTYRLLSEAEWEYAARAGSQSTYSFGNDPKELDRYAWFKENSGGKTHPVGEKLPNAFGLYDMHGNVFEWTQDCWNENYSGAPTDGSAWTTGYWHMRVVRGGSWGMIPQLLRSAFRVCDNSTIRDYNFGFRVARTD